MTMMVTLMATAQNAQTTIKPLMAKGWLEPVYALHNQVREELPEEKKGSLLVRPPEYFDDLIAGRTGALFGAMVEGKLAGMVAVFKSESWSAAIAAGRLTYPDLDGGVKASCGHGTVGIIQSLCVLKEYKNNGIAQELIEAAKGWSKDNNCAQLFSQVGQSNVCSWVQFMKQGFEIAEGWNGVDHSRYLLRLAEEKALKSESKYISIAKSLVYPDGAARRFLNPVLNAQLGAGGSVRLDASRSTKGALHFVLG